MEEKKEQLDQKDQGQNEHQKKGRKGHRKRNKGKKGLGFSDKEYVEQLKINRAQIAFFIFTVDNQGNNVTKAVKPTFQQADMWALQNCGKFGNGLQIKRVYLTDQVKLFKPKEPRTENGRS